jgi:hypothetical protein
MMGAPRRGTSWAAARALEDGWSNTPVVLSQRAEAASHWSVEPRRSRGPPPVSPREGPSVRGPPVSATGRAHLPCGEWLGSDGSKRRFLGYGNRAERTSPPPRRRSAPSPPRKLRIVVFPHGRPASAVRAHRSCATSPGLGDSKSSCYWINRSSRALAAAQLVPLRGAPIMRGVAPEVSAQRGTSGATNGGGGRHAPPTRISDIARTNVCERATKREGRPCSPAGGGSRGAGSSAPHAPG